MSDNTIGSRIKQKRAEKKIKQTELAKQSKVNQSRISDIETDSAKAITLEESGRIAKALEVSIDWLYNGDESTKPITPLQWFLFTRELVNNLFLVFIDALSAKAHVYAYDGDYDSFMDYDLQRYILGLNPIVMDAQTYATYNVINEANILNLRNVLEQLEMGSLKKRFDRIWNICNIRHTTVPKKTCYKILLKALDGADIEELNFDLREKYFNKKFGI